MGVVLKILFYSLISEGSSRMLEPIQESTPQRTETFVDQDFFFFFFVFLPFLGLLPQHMEVPRLGVQSEP